SLTAPCALLAHCTTPARWMEQRARSRGTGSPRRRRILAAGSRATKKQRRIPLLFPPTCRRTETAAKRRGPSVKPEGYTNTSSTSECFGGQPSAATPRNRLLSFSSHHPRV